MIYNPHFIAYLTRKHQEYGDKFDPSDLDGRFVKYFHTNYRIKIDDYGDIRYGTVGVTTGWKPVFLLIQKSTSYGSSITLGKNQKLLGFKPKGAKQYTLFDKAE